jgi:hypothetical protein
MPATCFATPSFVFAEPVLPAVARGSVLINDCRDVKNVAKPENQRYHAALASLKGRTKVLRYRYYRLPATGYQLLASSD